MPAPWEKYQKKEEGPWAKFEKKAPVPSALESAVRGGAQGLSLGFADELAGGAGAAAHVLKNRTLRGLLDKYAEKRDAYRAADAAAQKENPLTYGAGELAGGVALPGSVVGKGLKGAIALGLLQGAGSSESSPKNPAALASDIATGGTAGALGHGLGAAAAAAIPTAKKLEELGIRKAAQHLRPTPKVAKVFGPEKMNTIAREALESGAIKFGATAGKTAERLEALRHETGEKIGNILESANAKADPREVALNVQRNVIDPLKKVAANKPLVAEMQRKLDDFIELHAPGLEKGRFTKNIPAKQLEEEKKAVQSNINYLTDTDAKKQAMRDYATELRKGTEEAVNRANPALGKEFTAAKNKFGNLAAAQAMAERTGALTDNGTGLIGHLYDLGVGQEALRQAAEGSVGKAGLLGAARVLSRGKVNSSISKSAYELGQFLKKHPKLNEALKASEELSRPASSAVLRQNAPYNRGLLE